MKTALNRLATVDMWVTEVILTAVGGLLVGCLIGLLRLWLRGESWTEYNERRMERSKTIRRDKAIRRWLKLGDARRPIPNIGLECPDCGYALAGLTRQTCPECGRHFDIREFLSNRPTPEEDP